MVVLPEQWPGHRAAAPASEEDEEPVLWCEVWWERHFLSIFLRRLSPTAGSSCSAILIPRMYVSYLLVNFMAARPIPALDRSAKGPDKGTKITTRTILNFGRPRNKWWASGAATGIIAVALEQLDDGSSTRKSEAAEEGSHVPARLTGGRLEAKIV